MRPRNWGKGRSRAAAKRRARRAFHDGTGTLYGMRTVPATTTFCPGAVERFTAAFAAYCEQAR